MGDERANDDRSRTYAFNPHQLTENCFYVALGRIMSIDSVTIATWTGNKEYETDNVGLAVKGMRQVIETCGQRTSMTVKIVDLMNDYEDDYEEVNDFDELDFATILRVATKHGIIGPCIAVEVKVPGRIGHFVNLQRTKPEIWHVDGTKEWREEDDPNAILDTWALSDFQIYGHSKQTHDSLREGTVRLLMGRTKDITTVFGTKFDRNSLPRYEAPRNLRLRVEWEASESRWHFTISHHGHWGTGYCVGEQQTQLTEPEWQYQDFTPDGKGFWFIGEGFWKYSFDGTIWLRPVFEKCNMANGWGAPCVMEL